MYGTIGMACAGVTVTHRRLITTASHSTPLCWRLYMSLADRCFKKLIKYSHHIETNRHEQSDFPYWRKTGCALVDRIPNSFY